MRVMMLKFKDGVKSDGWVKALNVTDSTLKQYQEANLRELYDNELILDIESKEQADEVRAKLDKEGIFYQEWDTSSRGRHFHLLYRGLDKLKEAERLLYRSRIISKYKADPSKKNGFIAMEHRPHLKTGRYKTLVGGNTGVNSLDLDLVSSIKLRLMKSDYHFSNKKFDKGDLTDIKRKIKPSDLWNKWGMTKSGNQWDTPFANSVRKKCVSINDAKGVWYDFHCGFGGDIITAVEMKHDIGFKDALEKLKNGTY